VAVVVLLVGVALASHALGASTGRTAQVAVLSVHLVAVTVWLAALVALLAGTPARRLTVPVAASIVVVVATGVFNAHVQLGGARELLTSAYGRVLDAKVALVVVMIALGLAAAMWRRWEAAVAVAVLALAGVLGQLPNPVSVPVFSQRHPLPAGSPVATTSSGSAVLALALSPGRPGLNRLVVSVQHPDSNDVPVPVSAGGPIDVAGSCVCGAPNVSARLLQVDGGPALAGLVQLPRAGRWSLRLASPEGAAVADLDVSPPPKSDEIVVGVPADLSGADANGCQDQLLGVQVAASEVNERGVASGRAVRVVAVDTHGPDPAASVDALRSLGARLLAVPCGTPAAVAAVQQAAAKASIPVIGGEGATTPWSWPTLASPPVEGNALARQLQRQGGQRPLVVAGAGPREHAVAAAAEASLSNAGVSAPSIALGDPAATAERIRAADPDVVLFSLSAADAPPLFQALTIVDPNWGPVHGALGGSAMMSATVASTSGEWFKQGRVSIASEVNPADGTSLQYAARLQESFPGRHPSVDGVRGYVAGWLIANVLHRTSDTSPGVVSRVLDRGLRSFVFGPTRVRLDGARRGAETMAFFRTVFTNPLALAGLPGQVGHAGVFLGQGSFVQVTPWSG
jgi:ABC-type branched-subunit amino acid transport system substrate-binding protein